MHDHRRRLLATLIGATAIVAVGATVYSPAIHAGWFIDDDLLVTHNSAVRSGLWGVMVGFWIVPDGIDYFPLTSTAFWALWQVFGDDPAGYHVTSILLHIGSGLLLWRLLGQMRIPGAWAAAFIFTIHPACVESVAWVSELKNTLSLPLFLTACLCWVAQDDADRGALPPAPAGGSLRQAAAYVAALVFFLLAMTAKPSVVAMPVVTLLYAWWKRGRLDSRDLVHAAPFFLVSIALGVVTIWFQHGRAIGPETLPIGGVDSRIAIAGGAILFYLTTIFWPVNLMPIYPAWKIVPPAAWQFFPWVVIVATGWWMLRNRHGWGRHAIFAFGFFVLMIAPVIGFIDISYMRLTWVADHFVYVAMIGPIAAAAAAVVAWAEARRRPQQAAMIAAGATVATCLATATFCYAQEWVSMERLWHYTLARNPEAWLAHLRLGEQQFDEDDIDGAVGHFKRAADLRPDLGETKNWLGRALLKKRRYKEAQAVLEEALQAAPFMLDIHTNLAAAYAKTGRYADALERVEYVMSKRPATAGMLATQGIALCGLGDEQQGIAKLEAAISLDPELEPAIEALEKIRRQAPAEPPAGP